MNRVVLGFGTNESDEPAVRLLGRLQFTDAIVDVVHVIEPPLLLGLESTIPPLRRAIVDAMEAKEADARRDGAAIDARLRAEGVVPGANTVLFGRGVVSELADYADRSKAALITVGSRSKGAARAFLTGSVGRGLTIAAHQSLLIAHGWPSEIGRVRAVFATDHSDYANRCLAELLRLAPGGISHLTVVTVYPIDTASALRAFLPAGVGDPAEWIRKDLCERNANVIRQLAPLGCEFDSRIEDGYVEEVLPGVLREIGADLLILGAQGHGFTDRLNMGSTSLHEVLSEPVPVLVLRAPEPEPTG